MTMYLNGISVGSQLSTLTSLNTSASYCYMGNSAGLSDPLNGYLRHFMFSKAAWNSNSNITNLIRHVSLPSDPNRLAYF